MSCSHVGPVSAYKSSQQDLSGRSNSASRGGGRTGWWRWRRADLKDSRGENYQGFLWDRRGGREEGRRNKISTLKKLVSGVPFTDTGENRGLLGRLPRDLS